MVFAEFMKEYVMGIFNLKAEDFKNALLRNVHQMINKYFSKTIVVFFYVFLTRYPSSIII